MRWRLAARYLAGGLAGGLAWCGAAGGLAGCTPVPAPTVRPSASRAASPIRSPAAGLPQSVQTPPPAASPSPGTFDEAYAVDCAGRPGADRVIALVKSKRLVASSATVTVRQGPLCAGSWQYTVLAETDREPLQVVTQGPPTALVLVAAGTDVCSAPVRTQAPVGIITVAHCN